MFIMDVPSVPVPQMPIVLAQAATPTTPTPDFILKECQEMISTGDSLSDMRIIYPAGLLAVYLGNNSDRNILDNQTDMTSIKVTLLQGTTHGEIAFFDTQQITYIYDAIPNYVGNDKAIFMAEFEGKRYKIIVELHVFDVAPMENHPTSCPPPQLIKVNGKPVSGSKGYDSGYSFGSLSVTFADLAGGAVGQATGATITLDPNAAGHKWFLGSDKYPTNRVW